MNLTQVTTEFKGSSFNALLTIPLITIQASKFLAAMVGGSKFVLEKGLKTMLFCTAIIASVINISAQPLPMVQSKPNAIINPATQNQLPITVGAANTASYLPLLKGKRVGVIANPTSKINKTHLIDSLKSVGVNIKLVFAPEHGFRGDAENGAHIHNEIDPKTGIKIISLYGKYVKPSTADLAEIDILIFDIQDVGTRFYTYLTTLHYAMQACSDNNKPLIVLDRPNPNGFFVDGPMLEPKLKSMVGVHPIPIVHGMTLGELAKMINGEGWLKDSSNNKRKPCKLTVISCDNYNHNRPYVLPIPPSPNLPNQNAIYLYPTLCLLEGTNVSMGRGTDKPFECFGTPWLKQGNYEFIPRVIPGKSITPPYLGDTCRGILLTDFASEFIISYKHIYIEWLLMLYQEAPDKSKFFNAFFDKLAGSSTLRKGIIEGKNANEIRAEWTVGLENFISKRKPYLLYPFDPNIGLN